MGDKPYSATPLWHKSEVQESLRLPNARTDTNNQQTGASSSQTIKFNVLQSDLKPDAPEFIPRANRNGSDQMAHHNPKPIKNTAQNRLSKLRNEISHEFTISNTQNESSQSTDYDSVDMMRLKQIISSLTNYPGQFDDLLIIFMETIYPYFNDIIAMSDITQLLVNEAIICPNFRYTGARLCWYVEQRCPEFRADLHLKCKKALQENPRQQNVVLFIAELYIHLPHDSVYGALLIESFQKLLISRGEDNIKCVCQALKLTGFSLEENNKQALDELFLKLRSLKNSMNDGSALILLNSVLNLRESNWGRGPMESSRSSDSSSEFDQDYEEMVKGILYETNGEILTNEENEFLAVHATNGEFLSDDDDDPDALCNPEPEMDEEIQAAFEKFVKLSKG
ncbi:hypothetical protein GWI33_000575 [Rhynchophorus ferrugineus]|uniref:MIF4G domain-containing protein n=1 Tax=Rhynchophorus ferrugineus TaxID=354439 RepID=A0A834IT07_RHYFE|nr:hypothetical protein GWI33_000575 [Rhynchophorus ferrugineus]